VQAQSSFAIHPVVGRVFRVNAQLRMDQAGFNIFEPIRFFSDVGKLFDPHMTALQQADCLFCADFSI